MAPLDEPEFVTEPAGDAGPAAIQEDVPVNDSGMLTPIGFKRPAHISLRNSRWRLSHAPTEGRE